MDLNAVKSGMRVRTASQLGETRGMLVNPTYLDERQPNKEGVVEGFAPGHGGDAWWVKHDDGVIAIYRYHEFDPV